MPVYSTFFLIVALSSLGLPLLNGFVGEFLIIVGSYYRHAAYAAFASAGVVLAAVYLLWMYQRVFYGEITNEKNRLLPDCDFREKLILTVMVVVIIAMGVYPQPFLRRMDRSVDAIMQRVESRTLLFTDRAAPPGLPKVGLRPREVKLEVAYPIPSTPAPANSFPPTPDCPPPLVSAGGGR